MKRHWFPFWTVLLLLSLVAAQCTASQPTPEEEAVPTEAGAPLVSGAPGRLVLATTTSTDNSGLLAYILPDFEAKHNARVEVIAVGTGQALQLGENGDADVVLVHARAQEDAFVADGYGVNRQESRA